MAANKAQEQAEREYQEGWADRALENQFLKLPEGRHALLILEEPVARVNDFGKDSLVFQVMQKDKTKGVFNTSSPAIMVPLAKAHKERSKLRGSILTLSAEGEDQARRYKEVQVFATAKEYAEWAEEQAAKQKAETLPGVFGDSPDAPEVPF